jgi:uncharacterized protein (DUF4415 family)
MNKASTKTNSVKRIKISPATRALYQARDKSLDNADPEAPVLPPEMWENAIIGKYRGPQGMTPVSFRIDNDVLAWLKSKGAGHLNRINDFLRQQMIAERKR